MDTYITNGDHMLDEGGRPKAVFGEDERRQNAAFVLSVNKGSFKYNRELGTDHQALLDSDGEDERLLVLCREALADREDIRLAQAAIDRSAFRPRLCFSLESSPDISAEVIIHENI